VVEAKDIIPILVIGGLAYLALRGRAEEIPPSPPEEKPPIPPPPPYPPILELPPLPPEVEEAMKPITPEVERLAEETRRKLEEARRVLEEIRKIIEERRREAEVFTPPVIIEQPPPPVVTEYPMIEIPPVFEPRIPRLPGIRIRLSNSTLIVEDPSYIGKFITACVTWFCTNFPVQSIPHREPLKHYAMLERQDQQ
jgi:hypothetical protein